MARRFNFEGLVSSNGTRGSIKDILSRSSKAVCGAFEREVVVKKTNVANVKARLRSKGFIIVGTGPAGANSIKVWFNPAGVNL